MRGLSPRDLPSGARLVIRGFAFSPGGTAPKGTISINGRRVGTLNQLDPTWRSSELSLPLDTQPGERQINVDIHVDNPRSPRQAGLSSDERKLGLFVQSVRITSPYLCDAAATPLQFHQKSDDLAVLWSGWSHPDAEGCWTDGADASMRWLSPRDLPSGARLVIRGFAFSPDGIAPKGTISVNGRQVGTLDQLDPTWRSSELSVPLDTQPGERQINVDIHVDNPRSPRQAGLSSDERKLGLFVQSVRITLPYLCDAAATPLQFHQKSDDLAVLWSGWSHPDADGCWTDGADASMRWLSPRDLSSGARLVIRGFAFSPGGIAPKGTISVDGRQVGTLDQLDPPWRSSELSLPLDMQPGERQINVDIHVDNPRSPRQAGLSSDERKLGLFVQSVRIDSPHRHRLRQFAAAILG